MDDKPFDQGTSPLPDWATAKIPDSPWTQPAATPVPPTQQPIEPPPEAGEPKAPPAPQPATPPPPPPLTSQPASRPPILGIVGKLFIGIIVIVLIAFLGTNIFSFIKGRQAPKTVTLTYWGLWEDKNIMATVISDFEREHPDIKVDYQKRDIKQYRESLKARLASGQGPDIFRFHNSWLPMFNADLLPLPKNVLGENPEKDFYPVVSNDLKIGGAYFGIPLEIDTLSLFINTSLLKQANVDDPKTWNDIQTIAPLLTVKDSNDKIKTAGVALGTYDNISHASDIIALMFAQNGVNMHDIKKTSLNAQDALLFYTSFTKGKNQIWDSSLDSSLLAFSKGSLAMFFGYSWDIFTIRALAPDLTFKVLPVPQLSPDSKVTLASYWVEGVSKKSKNQKAAFEFLAFLTKKETLQKLYSETSKSRLFGEPYARVDLADSLKDNPYLWVVISQAKNATSTYFASDTYDNGLNSELNQYLGDAVRALVGNTSADTAVKSLIKGVEQVFTKYGVR